MNIGEDDNQDLSTFWPHQPIRSYVQQQLSSANLTYQSQTKRYAIFAYTLPPLPQLSSSQQDSRQFSFIFLLSKGYPITAPIIHINTHSLCSPSLKDCRDILPQLIGQQWHHQISLQCIVGRLPKFVRKVMQLSGRYEILQRIGQYHYNRYYQFQIVKDICKNNCFISIEKVEDDDVYLYVLALTSTHILLFKPVEQPHFQNLKLVIPRQSELTSMKLILCSEIQALSSIEHNRANRNEYCLKFTSFVIRNMEYSKVDYEKVLNITRSSIFMDNLLKHLKDYSSLHGNSSCLEIGVDLGNVSIQKEQQQLLSKQYLIENKIKFYFNNKTIVELFQAYLKLVEYYSNNNPPYQGIYLYKISNLFKRPDVQLVMASSEAEMEEEMRLMLISTNKKA